MADSGYLPSFNKEKILKLNVSSVKEPDIRFGIEQVMQEIRWERSNKWVDNNGGNAGSPLE